MSMAKYMMHFVSIKSSNMHILKYPRVEKVQPWTISKTSNVCHLFLSDHLNLGKKYCRKEKTHLSYVK